jgi:2-amino-4-hydroxy-6-hydroxymethyldihydropteridine diphosphokinase
VVTAYIGIGSNLDDPCAQVAWAVGALAGLPQSEVLAHSHQYKSPPLGGLEQPDYINAVAAVRTALVPWELLDELQKLEQMRGRTRGANRWAARPLDLDLLLYGDDTIDDERLHVPHSGLHLRAFVLYPLHELAPGLQIPGRGALVELVKGCSADQLQLLEQTE